MAKEEYLYSLSICPELTHLKSIYFHENDSVNGFSGLGKVFDIFNFSKFNS